MSRALKATGKSKIEVKDCSGSSFMDNTAISWQLILKKILLVFAHEDCFTVYYHVSKTTVCKPFLYYSFHFVCQPWIKEFI